MSSLTPEQRAAVDARDGSVLVSAGAGTGKTTVLVERFARAVLEDGVAVDAILAITFTEKAASQLKRRVRHRLTELGDPGAAGDAEAAWISTIHGFCARILRTHALAAGIDPEFRVLDAIESERLALDGFDRALADFLGEGADEERLRLLAAYTPDKLADMVRTAYAHLRSQGQASPRLPETDPPQPAGELEALRAAVDPALAELGDCGLKVAEKARGRLESCGPFLDGLADGRSPEVAELDRLTIQTNANALKGPACERYRLALEAYSALVTRHREHLDHRLLRELLELHDIHYAQLKGARSGLDFDDLELRTRDLLRDDRAVRERYSERFVHVMVDEFQDTNPLQNEILELLERDNLFRVGDERQSIYRFRHADVDVFRRHRDAAAAVGRERRITANFRSRGELLDAVDLVFSDLWGEDFVPLVAAPGVPEEAPRVGPCVELLLTDAHKGRWDQALLHDSAGAGPPPFGEGMREVTPWRAAEARLLAKRVDELTHDGGHYRYSDVVLLVRATTHIGIYERALEERGVPTHVLGGRGYWGQQQVLDLRAYLAALANPLDELALHSVLASPLVGVSVDALVLVGMCARRLGRGWGLWRVLQAVADGAEDEAVEPLRDALPDTDRDRLTAYVERFRAARAATPRLSLEQLLDRAITESGYDRAVLALPVGERRMANLRKLMRMAREFEAEEGRDLRAFIDFVAERDLISERQGEAPLEAEDVEAVRLMTIHRAKGLEFPVVCVADLGKVGRESNDALRISDDGRVGLRLASLDGGAVASSALAQIAERQRLDDEEEERRIFYVALTRAEEHLILSGATDLEKALPAAPMEEPMRWLWPVLAPGLAEAGSSFIATGSYGGRAVDVRCEVLRPSTVDELLPTPDRVPVLEQLAPAGLDALDAPVLTAVPVPSPLPISRLSYSSLERYRRCGYRFYLERALELPLAEGGGAQPGCWPGEHRTTTSPQVSDPRPEHAGLPGLTRGSIVHQLLEKIDFADPRPPPRDEMAALLRSYGGPVLDEDIADLARLVAGFGASSLAGRIARAGGIRRELPFAFTLATAGQRARGERTLLLNGVVDVYAEEGERLLVVDYKSNRLGDRDPAAVTEDSYSVQRTVYALAALRAGAPSVEVVYVFLERPEETVHSVFAAADSADLEAQLRALAGGVLEGRFEPAAKPHRGLCAGCPGQAALCSWGLDDTLRDLPLRT